MNKPNESSSVDASSPQEDTVSVSMGLLEHATDAYLLVRGEVVVAHNKSAARLLGNPTMQCSGNSIVEYFSCPIRSLPDRDKLAAMTKETLRSSLQELQETGHLHTRWTCYKYQGSALNVEVIGERHRHPNEHLLLLKPLTLPSLTTQTQFRIFNNSERIAQMGSWDWDLCTGELHWSDGLYRIYGRDPSQGPPTAKENYLILHPEDVKAVEENISKALNEQILEDSEYRILHPGTKEIRYLYAKADMETDEQGNPIRLFGSVKDITDQRQTEQQLQKALEQLNLSINTAQVGIWKLDLKNNLLEWNDRLFEMYQVTRDEFSHDLAHWRKRVHPEDLNGVLEKLTHVIEGNAVYNIEFRIIWPNGEIRHILASGSPIFDKNQNFTALTGVDLDITHIHRSEQARRENDVLLQAIAEVSPNAITVFNSQGNFVFANNAATKMLGLSMDTLMNMSIMELQQLGVDDIEEGYQAYLEKGYDKGEVTFQHTDGSTRYAQYHTIPINGDNHLSVLTDMTEAKHTEMALRQSEEKYRFLFHGAQDAIIIISNETSNILESNRAAEELLGYTSDEIHNMSGLDLLPPEHRHTVRLEWREQLKQKGAFFAETQWQKKDGSIIDMAISGSQLRLGEQDIFQLIGRDITERKRIETALRHSEEKYRSLFHLAQDATITVYTKTGMILEGNQAMEKLLGYSQEELQQMSGSQIVAPEVFEQTTREWVEQLQEKDFFLLETQWVRKDGTRVDVAVSGSRMGFYDLEVFQLIGRDITERKQTEMALRRSEEKYRSLYHGAHDAILTIDPSTGQILDNNQALEQLLGYTKEELQQLTSSQLLPSDELERVIQEWQLQTELAQGSFFLETQWIKKDGARVDVAISGSPVNIDGQEVHQLIGRDISARKRIEKQIRQHRDQLEDIVANRTRKLDALYKIASVNNQYHETKDILQAILDQALDAVDCEAGAIHYLDRETDCFELQVHRNLPPVIVPIIESVPEKQALLLYNAETDPQPTVLDQDQINEISAIPLEALGISYYAGVPIRAAGRNLGSLCVLRKDPEALSFTQSELALLTSIAEQTGSVWENARLRKGDQKAAVLEERQRLARNLHDSVTQLLYSMSLLAEAGHRTQDSLKAQYYLERLGSTARQALKEMRLLIYELRPLLLEKEGLAGALRHRLDSVESRSGVEYELDVDKIIDLDQRVEEELYRIALEALNNMLKHAQATHVVVKLQQDNGHILLRIADNGVGFDQEPIVHGGGLGLISMQERAARIHAHFTCTSSPNQGTIVEVKVPR